MKTDKFYPNGFVVLDGKRFVNVFNATEYLENIGFSPYEAFQYLEVLAAQAGEVKQDA